MSEEHPKITPMSNGPLIAKNLKEFSNSRGESITVKPIMALCRCGASKSKPFCDGSHAGIGFDDSKQPERVEDQRDAYTGKQITIFDNRGICSHAGYCTANLPRVFRMGVEPWIDPDAAPPDEIRRVIDMCPSGALAYSDQTEEIQENEDSPGIRISKNGPYWIRGGVELDGETLGDKAPTDHYTLCRCGKSRNHPRCDGSHWYAAFKDDEALTIAAANRAMADKEPRWFKVAEPEELEDGDTKALNLSNRQIVLSKVGDKFGAVQGVCPHQGGPLGDGHLDHGLLRCPWHGHPFDAISGKSHTEDPDLQTYEVEAREDGVYVKVAAPDKSAWTISHVMAETMVNWGITHVFGMVGHSNLGLAEAIRVQVEKNKLTYIGIRHEGAAAFACSGYAKVAGRPAACLTIAGPGATNLLTGLWDAKMDRAPVLALTGQINSHGLGTGAFQEIDLKSAFAAVADFSTVVLPGSDHAELVSLALKTAIVQRGVAHLIVPDEVQTQDAGDEGPGDPDGRLADTVISPSYESVSLALYRIARAKRPVFIVGYGARDAMAPIMRLAEKLNSPVLTTFKAKGQISDFHPLGCGVLGRSGTPVSSWFMNNADLLVVFGASFSKHTGIDHDKPIIQVDFDRMALAKFHPIDTPVWGEVGITAEAILDRLPRGLECVDSRPEIAEKWRSWREEKKQRAAVKGNSGLNSALIMETLSMASPPDAVFCLDVGNNAYSFGRYFECRGQKSVLCGYLGSIGFAFPAAIGASQAGSGRPIMSLSGDGGFAQYMGEFSTAVRHKLNLTHILMNNGELGKISKEQRDLDLPVWQTGLTNPDFVGFARECGGLGIRVESEEQLEAALKEAIAFDGPALVEIVSDPLLT